MYLDLKSVSERILCNILSNAYEQNINREFGSIPNSIISKHTAFSLFGRYTLDRKFNVISLLLD